MTETDWCPIPCIFCGGGLKNFTEGQNQPMGGTEFVGGGCYGSAVTDHGGFRYVLNLCDSCLGDAITSKHILKMDTARQPAPNYTYDLLLDPKDQGPVQVTETELLTQLREEAQRRAADTLRTWLFGPHLYPGKGYIGLGVDKLFVFCGGTESEWRGRHIAEWEGWPLEWHYECGVVTAGPAV